MKKMIVWGTAAKAEIFYNIPNLYSGYQIVAFVDNNIRDELFHDIRIVPANEISSIKPDKIVVCSSAFKEIKEQINNMDLQSMPEIASFEEIFNAWKDEIKKKLYKNYADSEDEYIVHFLNYYKSRNLNVFDDNVGPDTKDYVHYDNEDHPYIMFEGKRMYYPDGFYFHRDERGEYVPNILKEQGENSPHLYLTKSHTINEGDVIVDAGVCEGNFSLRYIEKLKRVYLIESDPKWISALHRTFAPYKDKVVYCNKFLSRDTTKNSIKLDDLIPNGEVDFIKMDIEGAEVDALLGAKTLLKNSNARLSVCCYHRHTDYENIKFILESLGYMTDTSKGYMCFIYDNDIIEHGDLRHGVVYGTK